MLGGWGGERVSGNEWLLSPPTFCYPHSLFLVLLLGVFLAIPRHRRELRSWLLPYPRLLSRIRSMATGEVDSWSSLTCRLRTEILWRSSCQRWRRASILIYFLALSRRMFSTMRIRMEPPKLLSMSDPAATPRQ